MLFCLIAMLALTRAEIVQRMRAPVNTQADGLVSVFANCPEDMRREYQSPVARFAADTVALLYRGEKRKPVRFERPGIIIHLGDVRTNITDVVARVTTNENEVTTRIYLKSPGGADLERFRTEVVRAFYRTVCKRELSESSAREKFISFDPEYQVAQRRARLEAWLAGDRSKQGTVSDETWDEEHLTLLRKVLRIGVASRRDVLTFASRLYFYPLYFDETFADGRRSLSFKEAIHLAPNDMRIRLLAMKKSAEIAAFGGGRSEELASATESYVEFLQELSKGEKSEKELEDMLLNADKRLELAFERAKR